MRIRRFNESIEYVNELSKYETLVDVLEAAEIEDFKYIFPVEKNGSLVNPENGNIMTGPRILIKYIGYGEDDHPFVRNFKPMPDRGTPGIRKEIEENPEAHIHTFVSRRILYLINTSDETIKRIHELTGMSLLFYRHEYEYSHGQRVWVVLDFGYYDENKYHFGISESAKSNHDIELEKYQTLVDIIDTTDLDFDYVFPIKRGGNLYHPKTGRSIDGPEIIIRLDGQMDHPFVKIFKRIKYGDNPAIAKFVKKDSKDYGTLALLMAQMYKNVVSDINSSDDIIKRIHTLTGLKLMYYNFKYEEENFLILNFGYEKEKISESMQLQLFDSNSLEKANKKDVSDLNEIFIDFLDDGKATTVECILYDGNLPSSDVIPFIRCLNTPGLNTALTSGSRGNLIQKTMKIINDNLMVVYINTIGEIEKDILDQYKNKSQSYINASFIKDTNYKIDSKLNTYRYILFFLKNRKEIEDVINKTDYLSQFFTLNIH